MTPHPPHPPHLANRDRALQTLITASAATTLIAVLIPSLTMGTVAVPPNLEVLLGAGGLLLLLLLIEPHLSKPGRWLIPALFALVATLGAHHLLLRTGFPRTHDGGSHLWALHGMFRSLEDGWIPSRWIAELGVGVPLGVHYGPLTHLPGVFLMGLGMTVYDAYKAGFLIAAAATAWTMYHAARRMTGRTDAALLAAGAVTFAPYLLLNAHYRGALGECMGLIAVPVFLEATWALLAQARNSAETLGESGSSRPARRLLPAHPGPHATGFPEPGSSRPARRLLPAHPGPHATGFPEPGSSRPARRLLLATLWMALSHPMTLFMCGITGLAAGAAWWLHSGRRPRSGWFLPVAGGLGLSAFWLVPAILEMGYTSVRALFHNRPPDFAQHGLTIGDWLVRRLWYGRLPSYRADIQAPGSNLEMPFYFGLVLLAGGLVTLGLACAAAYARRATAGPRAVAGDRAESSHKTANGDQTASRGRGATGAREETGDRETTGGCAGTGARETTGGCAGTGARETTGAREETGDRETTGGCAGTGARETTGDREAIGAREATGDRVGTGDGETTGERPVSNGADPASQCASGYQSLTPLPWALVAAFAVPLFLTWLPAASHMVGWPGFPEVQFAWRFLGPASIGAAFCLAYVCSRLTNALEPLLKRATVLVPLSLLGLVLWDAAPFTGAADWVPAYDGVTHFVKDRALAKTSPLFKDSRRARQISIETTRWLRVDGLEFPPAHPTYAISLARGLFPEYLSPAIHRWLATPSHRLETAQKAGVALLFPPDKATPIALEPRPWARLEGAEGARAILSGRPQGGGSNLLIPLPKKHAGGQLHLLEQSSPGWVSSIDQGPWTRIEADRDGFMVISIPPSARQVRLHYGYGTVPRKLGLLFSVVTALTLLMWARGGARKQVLLSVWERLKGAGHTLVETVSPLTRDLLLLGGISMVAYGFRLHLGSLENGTDAIYATAIRDLLERGDWLAPSVHGVPYLMKPPLFFWMGAVFAQLLGLSELAVRLPSAVGMVLAVLATFLLGRRLGGVRLGWLSALLLLASALGFEFSRRVFMDSLLTGLVAASGAAWLAGEDRPRHWWLAGMFTGLAILTKSYAGLFGAAAFGGYLLFAHRAALRSWQLWAAGALALLVPLPWFLAQLSLHRETFIAQNLAVFRLSSETPFSWHPTRPYFYVVALWEQDPVFTLLVCLGLLAAVARVASGERRWLMPFFWLVGPVAMYWNLTQQRLYYLLPLLPAAAVLGGLVLDRLLPRQTPPIRWVLPLAALFLWNAGPSISLEGPVQDPSPGMKAMAPLAGQALGALVRPETTSEQTIGALPESKMVHVWNDFFAAPEFYSAHQAVQLSPSRSLVDEIKRILVVGDLGVARFIQAPIGLWDAQRVARERHQQWVLLIRQSELNKLAPGLVGSHWIPGPGDLSLVTTQPTGFVGEVPLSSLAAEKNGYLAASRHLAQQGRLLEAASVLKAMAQHHPEDAAHALEIAEGLQKQSLLATGNEDPPTTNESSQGTGIRSPDQP